MKSKLINIVIGVSAALILAGCGRVEPGYVGIKVNQWGSQKGVEDYPMITGGYVYNPLTTDIFKFPTFVQNAVWDKERGQKDSPGDDSITFNSVEGAVINADIALAYAFDGGKIPNIFVEFRQSPEVITHGFMKNEINNAFNRVASTMKAADIFGEKKQFLLDNVKSNLNVHLGPKGFKFELISFHGGLRVDDSVQARINAVLEASQRAIEAETKVKQSKAEADQAIEKARGEKESNIAKAEGEAKSIALKAEAQAKANLVLAQSLTPALVQYEALQRWDGKLPIYNGGGVVPFINIGQTNK